MMLAEGVFDGYEGAGGGEEGFDLGDQEPGEFDDLLEAEGEDAIGVDAGADIPDGDRFAIARDDFLDVFVGELAQRVEIVFPDVHPIGDFAFGEIDQRAGDDGHAFFGEKIGPFIYRGRVEGVFLRLELVPADGEDGVIEIIAEGVFVFLVLDDRIDAAADDVFYEGLRLFAAIDEQFAVEHGELFGEVDGDCQGLVGDFGGFAGLVELAEGVGEKTLAFAETGGESVGLGKIEEVPVFLLLDDFHEAEAGEFDVEVVGLIAVPKPGGFEVERADAGHIPEEGDAEGVFVAAVEDEEAVAEINFGGEGDAFRAHGHRGHGRELCQAVSVAIDFELDGHIFSREFILAD